jgi:hypothetical protein
MSEDVKLQALEALQRAKASATMAAKTVYSFARPPSNSEAKTDTSGHQPSPSFQQHTRDPGLNTYVKEKIFRSQLSFEFNDAIRSLLEASDALNNKSGRARLGRLLVTLFYFEELPSEIFLQLAPLINSPSMTKDLRLMKSLFYLMEIHLGRGTAGTPTLLSNPSPSAKATIDTKAAQLLLSETWKLLQKHDIDPAIRRAALSVIAAAGRSNENVKVELTGAVRRIVNAADVLSGLRSQSSTVVGGSKKVKAAQVAAANNYELQHTTYLVGRTSGACNGTDELSLASFAGVTNPDPVAARHALALAAEVASRDPSRVVSELSRAVGEAADAYDAHGPIPPPLTSSSSLSSASASLSAAAQGIINMKDTFARLHLARLCAAVIYSDQSSGDVSRGGGPFWKMLVLLSTRDQSDMVRFGAMESLSGALFTPASSATLTALHQSATTKGQQHLQYRSSRDDVVIQQRRARTWRVLTGQAGGRVTMPGVGVGGQGGKSGGNAAPPPAQNMKLADVLGRLLLLALRKAENESRFCVAASIVASLAESRLAAGWAGGKTAQLMMVVGGGGGAGSSRASIASPDVDRVLEILGKELAALLDSPLKAAQRCAALEALLLLTAAGIPNPLTPTKLTSAAAAGGQQHWSAGMQDSLLAAIQKCAKARPKDVANFLGYASAVAAICPSGIDLSKIISLWDMAAASSSAADPGGGGSSSAGSAALGAAIEALSATTPATRPLGSGGEEEILRASKEEDGWMAFQMTAAWWLGEHANQLTGEYVGKEVELPAVAVDLKDSDMKKSSKKSKKNDTTTTTTNIKLTLKHAGPEKLLGAYGERSPAMLQVIRSLQDTATTAPWQVRQAAASALTKIAVRSGEPYRLQCYAALTALTSGDSLQNDDAMGLASVAKPALAILDRIYATQVTIDALYEEYGGDSGSNEGKNVDGEEENIIAASWPMDVVSSLAKRNRELIMMVEHRICTVPQERYCILGHRAAAVLMTASNEEGGGDVFIKFLSQKNAAAAAGNGGDNDDSMVTSRGAVLKADVGASGGRGGIDKAISKTKNKEIEDILSFGGGAGSEDQFGSTSQFGLASNASEASISVTTTAGLDQRNREIENLLAGRPADAAPGTDPWNVMGTASDNGNATRYTAISVTAATIGGGTSTPTGGNAFAAPFNGGFEGTSTTGGGGGGEGGYTDQQQDTDPWGEAASPPSSPLQPHSPSQFSPKSHRHATSTNNQTADSLGSGLLLHTFVADSSNPEELSVFEGDTVHILEESDGWMLVQDPSGNRGLVPTSYVRVEELYTKGKARGMTGAITMTGATAATTAASSPYHSRSHSRQLSLDYTRSKEDYLDNIFTSFEASLQPMSGSGLPTTPEEPATYSGGGGGGDSFSSSSQAVNNPFSSGAVAVGVGGGGGTTAAFYKRGGSVSSPVSSNGGGGGVFRTVSGAKHQYLQHSRNVSAASSADFNTNNPSMPGSPLKYEGPERGIVAGFIGEMEGELTVEPGDKVTVHSEVGGWARVMRTRDGKEGLVPAWAVGSE